MESPRNKRDSSPLLNITNQLKTSDSEMKLDSVSDLKMKRVKKTRRGKPKRWCAYDLLDSRPEVQCGCGHMTPPNSPCTSPVHTGNHSPTAAESPVHRSPKGRAGRRQACPRIRPQYSPGAPHNTNDFIMNDKFEGVTNLFTLETDSFDYDSHLASLFSSPAFQLSHQCSASSPVHASRPLDSDGDSQYNSDTYESDSSDSHLAYQQAEFELEYESAWCESQDPMPSVHHSMSHSELIQNIQTLSFRLAELERPIPQCPDVTSTSQCQEPVDVVSSLQAELSGLIAANQQLRAENDALRQNQSKSDDLS